MIAAVAARGWIESMSMSGSMTRSGSRSGS